MKSLTFNGLYFKYLPLLYLQLFLKHCIFQFLTTVIRSFHISDRYGYTPLPDLYGLGSLPMYPGMKYIFYYYDVAFSGLEYYHSGLHPSQM